MRTLWTWAVVGLLIMGCGDDSEPTAGTPDVVGEATADVEADTTPSTDVEDDTTSPIDCPNGHVPGPGGECMAVGIQGCAEIFINPDTGLCDPKPEHCPLGQIPNFKEGCTPVGIPDCAEIFMNPESGLCEPDPDLCGEGFIPVPSQGCVSLDPPGGCGEGTWGNIEELPGDSHVDLSYAGGDSDGSREKPYTNTTTAYNKTVSGGRMVLAAGDYDKGILISKSVSIIGRCSSMVTISGVRDTQNGPIVLEVGPYGQQEVDITISDLRISGPGIGLLAYSGPQVTLSRVVFDENQMAGLLVSELDTSVTLTDTLIARTQPKPDGTYGRGIAVLNGASLTLERSAVVENHESGLVASQPETSVSVKDTLIARTQPLPDGTFGTGIGVDKGASLTLERSAVVENHETGLFVENAGTIVSVTDTLIARTQPSPDGTLGRGIEVQEGASLTLERSAVVENHAIGLLASQPETSVSVKDTFIARTQPLPDGTGGRGIAVQTGVSLTVERSAVVENHEIGLLASQPETSVSVKDTLIARTKPLSDGTFGLGIHVQIGASLTVERSAVMENQEFGVGFSEALGSITDSLIADTLLGEEWGLGDGLLVTFGSVVDVHGVIARGNARAGILYNNSSGELEGCLSTENQVGMVVQGEVSPEFAEDNLFQGNEVNLILDGDFEIPDEVIAIPSSPDIPESDG